MSSLVRRKVERRLPKIGAVFRRPRSVPLPTVPPVAAERLDSVFSPSTRVFPSHTELFGLFLQPVQFHGRIADFGLQGIVDYIEAGFICPGSDAARAGKNSRRPLQQFLSPLRTLHRMQVKIFGDLLNGLRPFKRSQRYTGLKFSIMWSCLTFWLSWALMGWRFIARRSSPIIA
jgi:hypothetical protein